MADSGMCGLVLPAAAAAAAALAAGEDSRLLVLEVGAG